MAIPKFLTGLRARLEAYSDAVGVDLPAVLSDNAREWYRV